ncbi:FtsX-like permease family protein [Paracoccus sp. SSK6]|uniref:FtsX-like permease family protein n=1 Tax=Paracoccus sp. SSK6 TaxID=3143131 RepID=UPI003219A413
MTLLTGFAVLIGTALAGARGRRHEAAMLAALGAGRGVVLASFALRAGLLGLMVGAVAALAGIGGAWAVARFLLGLGYKVDWMGLLAVVTGGLAAALAAELGFALRAARARPATLLRASE